jgi:hypothetical protein
MRIIKSSKHLSISPTPFIASQICFYTIAGRPSFPTAFHGLAANIHRSTSSIMRVGVKTASLRSCTPSSLMLSGSGGKNVARSSTTYSVLSRVIDLSVVHVINTAKAEVGTIRVQVLDKVLLNYFGKSNQVSRD